MSIYHKVWYFFNSLNTLKDINSITDADIKNSLTHLLNQIKNEKDKDEDTELLIGNLELSIPFLSEDEKNLTSLSFDALLKLDSFFYKNLDTKIQINNKKYDVSSSFDEFLLKIKKLLFTNTKQLEKEEKRLEKEEKRLEKEKEKKRIKEEQDRNRLEKEKEKKRLEQEKEKEKKQLEKEKENRIHRKRLEQERLEIENRIKRIKEEQDRNRDTEIEKNKSDYNNIISEIKVKDDNYDETKNGEVITNAKIGFSLKNGYINVNVIDVFDKNGKSIVKDKLKPSIIRIIKSGSNQLNKTKKSSMNFETNNTRKDEPPIKGGRQSIKKKYRKRKMNKQKKNIKNIRKTLKIKNNRHCNTKYI